MCSWGMKQGWKLLLNLVINGMLVTNEKWWRFDHSTPWTKDVYWLYIRRPEDAPDAFWTSYVSLIYVLHPRSNYYCQDLFGELSIPWYWHSGEVYQLDWYRLGETSKMELCSNLINMVHKSVIPWLFLQTVPSEMFYRVLNRSLPSIRKFTWKEI